MNENELLLSVQLFGVERLVSIPLEVRELNREDMLENENIKLKLRLRRLEI